MADLQSQLDALMRYRDQGIPPGGFLKAVLDNDLQETVSRADSSSLDNLHQIMRWLYSNMPMHAWGSRARVDEWLAGGWTLG